MAARSVSVSLMPCTPSCVEIADRRSQFGADGLGGGGEPGSASTCSNGDRLPHLHVHPGAETPARPLGTAGAAAHHRHHHRPGRARAAMPRPAGRPPRRRAAGALGEDRDQPTRTQHADGGDERGSGRPSRGGRDLADPGQQPAQRSGEHLLLAQEHRATAKKSEQQRPVDERAVVGDETTGPVAGMRSQSCRCRRKAGNTTRCRSSGRDRASAATPRRAGRTAGGPVRTASPGHRALVRAPTPAGAPSRRRRDSPSVSTTSASAAACSGEVLRVESSRSRRRTSAEHLRDVGLPAGAAVLGASTRGADVLGRGEVHLQRRVRDDDAADVAALHDDPAARPAPPARSARAAGAPARRARPAPPTRR